NFCWRWSCLQRNRASNCLCNFLEADKSRRVFDWQIPWSMSDAPGQCRDNGSRSLVGAAFCTSRLGTTDSYHLARHTSNLFRADDDHGRCTAVFLFLITSTVGAVDLHGIHHRTLQRGPEEPGEFNGQRCCSRVVHLALLLVTQPE